VSKREREKKEGEGEREKLRCQVAFFLSTNLKNSTPSFKKLEIKKSSFFNLAT
jgi:hypothetical protein